MSLTSESRINLDFPLVSLSVQLDESSTQSLRNQSKSALQREEESKH